MKFKTAVGAALLGTLFGAAQASALDASAQATGAATKTKFETEYGRALPPIGFVNFCGRNPRDCQASAETASKIAVSPDVWNRLYQVNSYVNAKIAPISDQDLYGRPEFWTYPTDAGDCEDYVLLKKKYLEQAGLPADALLITVVLDEKNEGHAVLTVSTDAGDYVLDNRRDDILRWSDTDYAFLKRQSNSDPKIWVALQKDKTISPKITLGKVNN